MFSHFPILTFEQQRLLHECIETYLLKHNLDCRFIANHCLSKFWTQKNCRQLQIIQCSNKVEVCYSYESHVPVIIWLCDRAMRFQSKPTFHPCTPQSSSSSVVRASVLEHGGSWGQIPSGTRIFFRVRCHLYLIYYIFPLTFIIFF